MTDPSDERRDKTPGSTPYGPHRGQVDEAAGGADSSPDETAPSGEKAKAVEAQKELGHS